MWTGKERRKESNQPGRRESDQAFCPLHATHHQQIATLESDVKGKVSMKLFGLFVSTAVLIMIAVGGIMITSQSQITDKIVEIKTQQASMATKIEMHMQAFPTRYRQSPARHYEPDENGAGR
jgi:hypothetical protein